MLFEVLVKVWRIFAWLHAVWGSDAGAVFGVVLFEVLVRLLAGAVLGC